MKNNMKRISFAVMFAAIFLIASICTVSSQVSRTNTSTATNLIVDIDSTSIDSNLGRGDSGLLTLVVKNTGGQEAEQVTVWIQDTSYVHINKKFYIGTIEDSESKTVQSLITIASDAKTGLTSIPVTIYYDGYDSDGDADENLYTGWSVPVRIYANPLFQISPSKTTYSKDSVDKLTFTGLTRDEVSDLTSTLSSSCLTVIGSSRNYIGKVSSNSSFKVEYEIKPTTEGVCSIALSLSYSDASGNRASDNLSLGLNVEKSSVDFKVLNISYSPASPGEKINVKAILKNIGKNTAEDTTISLSLSDPFVPVDTTEIYIGKVSGGETIEANFNVAISGDADITAYSLPLTITYTVGGTSYSVEKDVGIDVSGTIILEVINVEASGSSVKIDIANIGTRTAESIKATLTLQGSRENLTSEEIQKLAESSSRQTQGTSQGSSVPGLQMLTGGGPGGAGGPGQMGTDTTATGSTSNMASSAISYKSDIKSSKQATFTFDIAGSGDAILTLEYAGTNNERVTQTEKISLGSSSLSTGTTAFRTRGGGTSLTTYALYGIVALLVVWVLYRKYKKKPLLPAFIGERLKKNKK